MEKKRAGLPRALLYFRYGPFWQTLLQDVGYEVIVSPETTAPLLKEGMQRAVGDLCLPVKLFLGHVSSLRDGVDILFLPRYVSDEPDSYLCPKIIGLPDVVRACFSNLPPIVAPSLHRKRDGEAAFHVFAGQLSAGLGLKRSRVEEAVRHHAAASAPAVRPTPDDEQAGRRVRVGVIGRDYLLFDRHVGGRIFRSIREVGAVPVYRVPGEAEIREAMTVIPKWVYWSMGKEVVAAAHAFFLDQEIDGVINLCSAACGPDSFTGDLIRKRLNTGNRPYLSLSVDEHTSDVGLLTRIEAFVDMLMRVTA